MKKIVSFFAAMFFTCSMMAIDFTLSSAAAVTQEGVTVSFDKGAGGTAPAWYSAGLRLYAKNTVTISSESPITAISFNWEKQGSKAFNTVSASVGEYTHPSVAGEGKWTGSASSVTFTVGETGQLQLNTFSVYLNGQGGNDTVPVVPEDTTVVPLTDPTNCAEAAAAAMSVSANNELYNGGKEYTIPGYVTEIAYAYDATKGNMSFWMADTKDGGKVLEAYKCTIASAENAPVVGDKVAVTGKLTKYNTTPEFATGCTVTILEHAQGGDTTVIPVDTVPVVPVDTVPVDTVPVSGGEIVITPANCGWSNAQAQQSGTVEGVTVAVTSGMASSGQSPDQIRIYQNATLTISAESVISKIEFTCTANGTAKYGPGCFAAQDGYSFDASGKTGTWTGSAKSVTFTASVAQVRATQIVVTLEGGDTPVEPTEEFYLVGSFNNWTADAAYKFKANTATAGEYMLTGVQLSARDSLKVIGVLGETTTWYPDGLGNNYVVAADGKYDIYFRQDGQGGDDWHYGYIHVAEVAPVVGPTTCAEAREAALSVSANNELYNGGATYTIQGYVTSIAYAYDAAKGNMSFWMADTKDGGQVLEAYKCTITSADSVPAVGDKVAVTGQLTKYNTTPEFAAGCTVVIIEKSAIVPVNLGPKTIAEFLNLKNTTDTCVLTGIVSNIKTNADGSYNKYGNFDLTDETGKVYVYGLLTAEGVAQQFQEMGVDEGDTLTIKAVYFDYNGTPQAKNAVFVEVKNAGADVPADWTFVKTQYVVYETDGYIDINLFTNDTYSIVFDDEGSPQLSGDGDGVVLTLDIAYDDLDNLAGSYNSADQSLDLDYSYAYSFVGEQSTEITFTSGTVTIALNQAQDGYVLTYSLVASNGATYAGTANIPLYEEEVPVIPTAETTVNLIITDGQLSTDEGGFWALGDVDSTWVQLFVESAAIAGQYTEADLDMTQSAIFIGEEDYTEIYTATLTVVANGEGAYTLTGSILCYNNTLYNVTMTLTNMTTGIEEAVAAGKAVKVIRNGQLVIEKAGKKYTVIGAEIR